MTKIEDEKPSFKPFSSKLLRSPASPFDSQSLSMQMRVDKVDTSPRFQKGRSTLAQGRSTLDPVSSRPVCLTGRAGRH
ncbi:hypothetical protein Taro_000713 [Colocasia esculenta]|uniref:Uncharacterized protein n=1 Tax=Colocasia esculenta TaxID=4460 RepID=A0A843TG30_COLES|nr:hypothetical protein [Colocasia esculenta]